MSPVLLDTSYFVALFNRHDDFHSAALRFSTANERSLLTTSAVILEVGASFSAVKRRPGFLAAMKILDEEGVEIVHVDADLQRRALQLFRERPDKDWSLADCISFLVMEDRQIREAATSDRHFEEAGFIALLRHPQ